MSSEVVESATSQFSRLGTSLDSILDRLRSKLLDAQRTDSELVAILEFPKEFFETQCREWVEEQLNLVGPGEEPPFEAISNAARAVAELEAHLLELYAAISWSQDFAGYLWWIRHRQGELNISNLIIVPTPASDFVTDTRGLTARCFRDFVEALSPELPPQKMIALSRLRILRLPRFDGTDARWHPLSLAHELGHLVWDKEKVVEWLATVDPASGAGYAESEAINTARRTRESGMSNPNNPWFNMLVRWLVETACDSILAAYYGTEGLNALETYVQVQSGTGNSSTHPPITERVMVQRSQAPDAAGAGNESQDYKVVWQAYCALAPRLRDEVHARLLPDVGGEEYLRTSQRVIDSATAALHATDPIDVHSPSSQHWLPEEARLRPSAIESGLVRTLWQSGHGAYASLDSYKSALVSRSMESLSFVHRFERAKHLQQVPTNAPIPNVLWISRNGVGLSRDEEGEPSFDIRLGRFFITFLRNHVPSLDSLDSGLRARQLQREVEIGWGDRFVLHPNEMVLGVTFESLIVADDCTVQVLSRSSLGRLGLLSATAVQVQPGFRGCLTLELVNLSSVPINLAPGQRVAQVVPYASCGRKKRYAGHYQDADWKPRFSNAGSDWDSTILASMQQVGL